MDGKATLSKIDTPASVVFNEEVAEHIHLHVKEKLRKRTDGRVTRWDVSGSTLSKIISRQLSPWRVL